MGHPLTFGLGHDGTVGFARPLTSFRITADRTVGVALVTILAVAGVTSLSTPRGGAIAAIKDQDSKVPHPTGSPVGCSTAVASAPTLTQVDTRFENGLLEPFGVAFASDSKHVFVDSLFTPPTTSFKPTLYRDDSGISVYSVSASGITLQRVDTFPNGSLVGMALSPNGREWWPRMTRAPASSRCHA
jgi:hypothetical protein